MSIARVYKTAKVRKDWKCGKCGAAIRKGIDGRVSFAVGFRGFEQTRCTKPECYPTRSELESSAVSSIYSVIDDADLAAASSAEELTQIRDDIVAACEEVAYEYESNEMYEINADLQERAEMITSAGEELASWEPDGDEPEEEMDCPDCDGTGTNGGDDVDEEDECETCEGTGKVESDESHDDWMDAARESLQEAIDAMELP